jgi:hypothetical protein
MKTIVFLIIGIAVAAGIIVAIIFGLLPSSSGSDINSGPTERNEGDTLYLYLFKENSDTRDSNVVAYPMLYDEMTGEGGIGRITKPSFEQIHYGIGTDGIYKNWLSDDRIERFSSVKMIISDSIKKPDGSPLKQEDFSPDARFFYSPYYGASLAVEYDGTVFVINQDRYMNPKHLPPDRMIGVVTLPVEAADFERINSHYGEIKEKIENFEPRQLQTPPATILHNPSERIFDNLVLISERTSESIKIRSGASFDTYSSLIDTHGISLRLYHGTNATNEAEIVAISLSNPAKSKDINVYQLAISGYVSIGNGSAEAELLSRPVISDAYNVIKPTTTNPITIPPGQSIMAYIQGSSSFDIDRYAASACYSYNGNENHDLGNQTTYSDQNQNNHYCINIIQQEEGSLQNIGYKTKYNHTQIPDLHMIVANTGKSYAGEEGSYCWDNMCADSIEIVPENIIGIDKGSEIEFKIVNYRQPEEFNVYVQSPQPFVPHCIVRYDNVTSEEITTCDEPPKIPQFTQVDDIFHYRADMPSGIYKVWVFAIWQIEPPYSQGDASYYYMVQVK